MAKRNEWTNELLPLGTKFQAWSSYLGQYKNYMIIASFGVGEYHILDIDSAIITEWNIKHTAINNCGGVLKSELENM